MSNIVPLRTKKTIPPVEIVTNVPGNEAKSFIMNEFFDWCHDNGVDVSGTEFKYASATILTVMQGLMHKVDAA